MATSTVPLALLFSLLAATASARPCKTLFYFSATTTTTYYPSNSLPRNPNVDSLPRNQNPRYLTLIFTSTTTNRFPEPRPSINFDSKPALADDSQSSSTMTSSDFPLKFYSSVSSSIRDRTKDIISVVGALLFGVGCGVLTAAIMYFVWALFYHCRVDFEDASSSSDDDDDDDVAAAKKKLGYVAVPTKLKVVDDDLKKPAPPAKEVV
ncbi:hypothetical protein CDL12_23676 [Handroanthus impetiginosus]|uniref:Uncharacterized protein n=1 Tax=Handroanthus impetiginosus TaxID=429701 RepID=A0A2G9GET1_9LAMI|nr:hypothetical protein CDL12_23676 [Handroanthus impetiginosus]